MNIRIALLLLLAATGLSQVVIKGPPARSTGGNDVSQGVIIGNLSTAITECSGLARPNLYANRGYVWLIQDGNVVGTSDQFFALRVSDATIQGKWQIGNPVKSFVDHEECGSAFLDGQAYLYAFDSGNNAGGANSRGAGIDIRVYRCKEPTITGSDGTIASADVETLDLVFPGGNTPGNRDCEGNFVDPDTGKMWFITKRMSPPQVFSAANSLWGVGGTQTLTYEGKLATDTSATSTTIGTGSKSFTTTLGLTYSTGMALCITSRATANNSTRTNLMEGTITSIAGTALTVNVTSTVGAGTFSDWDICPAITAEPGGNNGTVTGATIDPTGEKIVLVNYGWTSPTFHTGMMIFPRTKSQTIMQALSVAPVIGNGDLTGSSGRTQHYNGFVQREAICYDYGGDNLITGSEYVGGVQGDINPFYRFPTVSRQATTVQLQEGLNGYTGTQDTYIGSKSTISGTSQATTASIICDQDYNTSTTIAAGGITSFSGGTQINVAVTSAAGFTVGKNATINGNNIAAYNGTFIVDTINGNNIRLRRPYTVDGSATGNARGHEDTTNNGTRLILIKFDLSPGASGIPANCQVTGAKFVYNVGTEGQAWSMHKMLVSWTETDTWTSLTDGVTANDVEARQTPDAYIKATATTNFPDAFTGRLAFNVPIATIQDWIDNPSTNYGWMIQSEEFNQPGDGFQMLSEEDATVGNRPMLIISYVPK